MPKYICLKTFQFRGYVAEKGEAISLRDDELEDKFLMERVEPVDKYRSAKKRSSGRVQKQGEQVELPLDPG